MLLPFYSYTKCMQEEFLFVVLKKMENEPEKSLRNWMGVGTRR